MLQSARKPKDSSGLAANDSSAHIVVVEDDAGVRTLLARILRERGYEVSGAVDGEELYRLMNESKIDLILLDIMLPGENGLELCRAIRTHSNVPIMIVSARGQESDRVAGLDLGADDYIAKPFGRHELLARVRAVLRRLGGNDKQFNAAAIDIFDFAGWNYDAKRRELTSAAGAEVELTAAEHELLVTLLRNAQRMISRERLLEMARSRIAHSTDRSIDVLISRLRRKLGDNGRQRPIIRTIRGVGYMFAAEVAQK